MRIKWKYLLMKYLKKELIIEYKACLYFCCILFFYFLWLALQGIFLARVLYMCEMILSAYLVGYLQMYVLHNFDEAEYFGRREFCHMLLCSLIYAVSAHLGGWFDRHILPACCFFLFMLFTYSCVYIFHRLRRAADTKNLNLMLTKYKEGESFEYKYKGD